MKTDFVKDCRYMFQANYKDTRITLTETVLLSWIWTSFCFLRYFQKLFYLNFQEFWKTCTHGTIIQTFVLSLHCILQVSVPEALRKRLPAEHLPLQKQPFTVVYKKRSS